MNSQIKVEVVTAAPVEEIVDLYRAGGWWKETRENRERIGPAIRGSFCFMVARAHSGKIVGMGRAISDGASDAYIQDVVVLEEYRGHGIGRELIQRLTQHCVERGIEWIGLVAEPGTAGFYERLGYGALKDYEPMLYAKRG